MAKEITDSSALIPGLWAEEIKKNRERWLSWQATFLKYDLKPLTFRQLIGRKLHNIFIYEPIYWMDKIIHRLAARFNVYLDTGYDDDDD